MKNQFLKSIFILSIIFGFSACSGDDDQPIVDDDTNDGVIVGTVITGDITEDLLVPTGNYTLKGSVFVKDGATLTIEKGSTITVTAADQAAGVNLIIVERGGKIIADGTAAEPIVFTSENQNAEGGDGDWGGIGIHGKARINAPGGESLSEAGQVPYGGNDDADSSGILRFVRIEYAGAASSDGSFEFNAFSFFGVGSGTILQNCEAFEGADDGFEFFGGTVNGTNLSMVGMEDDSIDWDEGYRGTLNNIVIYQYDNIGDFAFELANRSGENNATPRSRANVNDVTVRGSNRSGKAAFDLKQGTGGIFNNIVVTNVESVIFLNNQLQEVQNGDLEFTNANFTYSTNLVVNNVDGTDVSALFISENPSATGANTNAFTGWSRFDEL